jgi:hypothetical protein
MDYRVMLAAQADRDLKEIALGTLETDAGLLVHLKTKERQKDHSRELVDE